MEHLYTYAIFLCLFAVLAIPYWVRTVRHRRLSEEKYRKNSKGGNVTPVTLHPQIDLTHCIGCGSCVAVCPENVLGIVNGRAAIVNGLKCVGHAMCAEVCPVQAITLGFGSPKQGMEIPYYDEHFETNIRGLYVVGELGGIGLIKNAVNQSMQAVEHIASRKPILTNQYDAVIVGAGPAGLSAALALRAKNLRYVVLEQDSIGGTIYHYPRQKLVLTSPVELPLHGPLKVSEISKENLLDLWMGIVGRYQLNIMTNHKVESIQQHGDSFVVKAGDREWSTSNVLLAIGRRGTPRKLGVVGEELPKVAYKLIEAHAYQNKNILVVGGGDSAVEAAVGLAAQPGNVVTLSYRRDQFVRLKEKNEEKIRELMHSGRINVILNSNLGEIGTSTVKLITQDGPVELANDFVFIFAGGELPTELLRKAGVQLRGSGVASKAA